MLDTPDTEGVLEVLEGHARWHVTTDLGALVKLIQADAAGGRFLLRRRRTGLAAAAAAAGGGAAAAAAAAATAAGCAIPLLQRLVVRAGALAGCCLLRDAVATECEI